MKTWLVVGHGATRLNVLKNAPGAVTCDRDYRDVASRYGFRAADAAAAAYQQEEGWAVEVTSEEGVDESDLDRDPAVIEYTSAVVG